MKWGILGAANIAQKALIPAIREAGSTVHAVAARDLSRAETYARHNQIERFCSYDELLADPDIDIIYNPLPNSEHLPLTVKALQQGKHVLCEKSLALNASEVRQMAEAQEASGKKVMEAFFYRFHPQIQRTLDLIAQGAIGDIRVMRSAFSFVLGNPGDIRWDPRLGGGAFYDVGCYPLDLMRLIAGTSPRAVQAFAQRTPLGVDHTLSAVLDFGHCFGHLDCSFSSAFEQHLTVVGTTGILHLNAPFVTHDGVPTLTVGDHCETFTPFNGYAAMVSHFEKAIQGEVALRYPIETTSLEHAEAMDRVLMAAEQSSMVSVQV